MGSSTRTTQERQGNKPPMAQQSGRAALLGVGSFCILVIVVLVAWAILQGKADAHRTAEVTNSNLSQAIADNLNSMITQIDLGLMAIQDEVLRQQRLGSIVEAELAAAVSRQDERHSNSLGFRIFGADGRLRYGTKNISERNADISNLDDFNFLRDHPGSGLHVSAPVPGVTTQLWLIVLGRRINNPDGSFGGAVFAPIPIQRLMETLAAVNIGPNGVIVVTHRDHKIAAWVPVSAGAARQTS
ncbi:MAG TPA: hypothetical protein HPQ04_05985 [Rhodospirillaceae bacterium]|nr:hypothetical protein [Rhodospirillaceae bacterium]